MLVLDRVGKTYPNGVRALDGISLAVAPGEILVVIGGSGCGKSTMLRTISGLDPPTQGRVVLECPTSNIWWRLGSELFTPSLELGILAGVTRAVVLGRLADLGYVLREGMFEVDALTEADEAFTSSSVREVMPVVALDGTPIGDGAPGRAVQTLQTELRRLATKDE